MKRPARFLVGACFAAAMGATVVDAWAAEAQAPTRVLIQLDSPDLVIAAHWTRLADAYVLRVVIDKPVKDDAEPRPAPSTRDQAPPTPSVLSQAAQYDGPFFIGNTIAQLRGLDPAFGCRTLTLVDGRRPTGLPPSVPHPTLHQPYPPKYKDLRIDVWLLKADGTQILPATYSCDWSRPESARSVPHAEVSYEFALAGIDQAVAAAIRVEDKYFIQKLAPE
jgi:hypothetical protein